jgi:hypothetical protein
MNGRAKGGRCGHVALPRPVVSSVSAGMNARFLLASYEGPWEVALNVYALMAVLLLACARPVTRSPATATNQDESAA